MQNKALHAIHNIEDNQSIMGKVPDIEKKVKRIKFLGLDNHVWKQVSNPSNLYHMGRYYLILGLKKFGSLDRWQYSLIPLYKVKQALHSRLIPCWFRHQGMSWTSKEWPPNCSPWLLSVFWCPMGITQVRHIQVCYLVSSHTKSICNSTFFAQLIW